MTDIKPHETWSVLRALAIACPDGGSCSRTSIRLSDSERVDKILAELVVRKVLETPQDGYYKIRVGLFREWLIANPISTAMGAGRNRG